MPREPLSSVSVPVWLQNWVSHAARRCGGRPGDNASSLIRLGLKFLGRVGFGVASPPVNTPRRLVTRRWLLRSDVMEEVAEAARSFGMAPLQMLWCAAGLGYLQLLRIDFDVTTAVMAASPHASAGNSPPPDWRAEGS